MLRRILNIVTIRGIALTAAFTATAGCGGPAPEAPGTDAAPETGAGMHLPVPVVDAGDAALEAMAAPDGGDGGDDASDGEAPRLSQVNKIDLLFDIDNSASMGDKQELLARAIPDLIQRLVFPNCVDSGGNETGVRVDVAGHCSVGNPEFSPVRDMHIGIVSSSLGPRLGDVCPVTGPLSLRQVAGGATISRHNDDQGRLLSRGGDPSNLSNYTETPVTDTGTAGFLDWFPQGADDGGVLTDAGSNHGVGDSGGGGTSDGGAFGPLSAPALGAASQLGGDFQTLVAGVHAFGCGIESQLESWYRFLVQPDPYASLVLSGGRAQWQGVDTVLLAQRAAFLRPDSLVAVIVLSDENDSEVDVRSFGGSAWNFMSTTFAPPRGTSACQSGNPAMVNSAACTSCGFGQNRSDPSCMTNGGVYPVTAVNDWGYDLNLRHVHEKEKYGVSVQFPIERYVLGLTSLRVPDRDGEYPPEGDAGGYASSYQGRDPANMNCTNPLFAASLPAPPAGVDPSQWQPTAAELCHLQPGRRTSASIYYSHIGGIPHQLLQTDPANPSSPQKPTLTAADWTLLLGRDPQKYDYTGIDPHMVESFKPRLDTPVPTGGFSLSAPTSAEGTDPISGREWITDSAMPQHQALAVDREYACIFKLEVPRQCDPTATAADPTLVDSCDCTPPVANTGTFTHEQVPAVCHDTNPTQQDYAKAYPTIREILLAKLLGEVPGANEGVVSSLCPIHTVEPDGVTDPLYGYRPAMSAIVNRLRKSL